MSPRRKRSCCEDEAAASSFRAEGGAVGVIWRVIGRTIRASGERGTCEPGRGAFQPRQVRVDHHRDELPERDARLPAELFSRLRRVADQVIDLGRPDQRRIRDHVPLRIEPRVGEGRSTNSRTE